MPALPTSGLQLRSLITADGVLKLFLETVAVPAPAADEVLVRVLATPINPSDLGLLFGAADMTTAKAVGSGATSVVTAAVPPAGLAAMKGRLGEAMAVGNEGAGVVVQTGSLDRAQAMLGKTVAMIGGAMFTQYRCIKISDCMVLPDDATAADGASCFVNPLTALAMAETMRLEGHTALVHTAAASNLGIMLNRICLADGIALVNIVRGESQAALLRGIGAKYVCDSSTPDFLDQLTDAIAATGATLAFDAVSGGKLAGQILTCMETAVNRTAPAYSRYGSTVHKQVYVYGMLDPAPIVLGHGFGMAWGVGGWLIFPFLQKIGPAAAQAMRQRIVSELKTTFASAYSHQISLTEALQLDHIAAYSRRGTGQKYLLTPNPQ